MSVSRSLSLWMRVLRCVLRPAAIAAFVAAPSLALAANTFQDFSADFPAPPLPPAQVLTNVAHLEPGSLNGGTDGSVNFLRLVNDGVAGTGQAGLNQVPSNVGPYNQLVFEFDIRMNDPVTGADGFSFAYLPVANHGSAGAAPALGEEPNLAGALGVGFDTWNNSDADDNDPARGNGSLPDSLSIHWNGAQIGLSLDMVTAGLPEAWLENDATKHVLISLTPTGADQIIDLQVFEPSTGLTATMSRTAIGMPQYDGRIGFSGRVGGENQNQDIDNVWTTFDNGTPIFTVVNDFDAGVPPPPSAPTLLGGTPYAAMQHANPPGGTLSPTFPLPPAGGPADGDYRLTENIGSQQNSIAFDKTFSTLKAGQQILGSFDIRVQNDNANTADGMSFMILDTAIYGDSGPLAAGHFGAAPAEDPNFPGVIGLGFDTFDNDEDFVAGDPNGCGGGGPCLDRLANSISAHANGVQLDQQFLPNIAYNDGNWIEVQFALSIVDNGTGGLSGFLDVLTTDLATGEVFLAFAGLPVDNLPENVRFAFAARTGGEQDIQSLDNVNIQQIPEPSSILIAVSAIGLVAFVQRRRMPARRGA